MNCIAIGSGSNVLFRPIADITLLRFPARPESRVLQDPMRERFVHPNGGLDVYGPDKDQEETDRYWNAITGNGGQESDGGRCKDRWGYSWQITSRVLLEATTSRDKAAAQRVYEAMMTMPKMDVATIEAALRGESVNA